MMRVSRSALFAAGEFFQIGFDLGNLVRHHAFEMAQVVEDFTLQIHFHLIADTADPARRSRNAGSG